MFPCPRSRLRISSRETDLTVPSRVGSLILHTHAESGAYSRGSSPESIYNANHLVSPEFIRSRNRAPIAFTKASPPAQGQ